MVVWPRHPIRLAFYDRLNSRGHSAVGQAFQAFGIARPLHRDLGGGVFNLAQIVGRERDGGGTDY